MTPTKKELRECEHLCGSESVKERGRGGREVVSFLVTAGISGHNVKSR